ncbi:MAG TPA: post-COAP-1 domain-containing protein [Thermoleophilaceae bacterium]
MVGAAAIAQPASAQLVFDCQIGDGGRIPTASGDQATFGGSASTSGVQLGHQVYVDHGPATPLRFRSLTMNAIVCDPDGRRADMAGTGTVELPSGAQQVVGYDIRVRDLGELPFSPPDTYRITLSNGYDSGEQLVRQGNIQIEF